MKIQMKSIYKSFGSNNVLKNVNFSVQSGEICALLGENGAGKSTLMNILGGVLPANSGEVFIDDNQVFFSKPSDAIDAKIAFIHQELNLINDLNIYENMFINRELKTKNHLLDTNLMIKKTNEVFKRMNISLNPKQMVRTLDASYKQIVEIAKALMMDAKIIIMDEPTSSLTDSEIERVFDLMKSLKTQGVGMIFISHKLNEVMEICDTYSVLRDGILVNEGKVSSVSTKEIAKMMVGHEVRDHILTNDDEYGKEILKIENLSCENYYKNISLELHQGEILGVTGLLGDGRTELFQTIFGAFKKNYQGKIFVDGKNERILSTGQAVNLGIGYVPRNRKENGIVKDLNILDNGTLATISKMKKNLLIDSKRQISTFKDNIDKLHIKMEKYSDPINSLSGGNQQKVVLAKWLSTNPKILILDNPTQGVDVGAKEEIYDIILKLAKEGVAIVVLSSEANEIIRLCRKSYVLYHGKINGIVENETMSEHNIMHLATGGQL
ncbi:MAG: sugar ABC transporter ATP-binding protein [Pleomorphochaeta sp.]